MSLALYYSPGACSIAPHIALEEAGAGFEARRILLAEGQQNEAEYRAINPRGKVPLLLIDGEPLSELPAIMSYLGARFGAPGAIPQGDGMMAARVLEAISWCSSTVHIAFAHVFRPERFAPAELGDALRATAKSALAEHFAEIDARLAGGVWLVGDVPSGADGYIFAFLRWARRIDMDVTSYAHWLDHTERMLGRAAVQRAITTEGLLASEWIAG